MNSSAKTAALFLGLILPGLSALAQSNPGWTLAWADEFTQPDNTSPNSGKWTYDTGGGGWGNSEFEYYTSRTNNARIENNQLVIEARQESFMGSNYTSARLKTQGKASWTYGRMEARMKIPRGQGMWPAFWMLGANIQSVNWPACGEIDIMENIGREPAIVHGTMHGPGYSGGNGIGSSFWSSDSSFFADDFHIYAIEWTTNQIRWFVDGVPYFTTTPASLPNSTTWVFNQPQFILLNLAVGGGWPGNPDGTTVFPQRLTVDYVRVYAPTSLPACGVPNALVNPGFEAGGLANWTASGAGFNTVLENVNDVPVHDGVNVFKVFGQFTGNPNDSGVSQDVLAGPGQVFSASGWALTPSNDTIADANTAWIEASFLDSVGNTLAVYRSAIVSASTSAGSWLNLAVTNQISPVVGSVTNLIAPAGTSWLRYKTVFHQPAAAAGSVLFDDLKLAIHGNGEYPTPVSVTRAGSSLNLNFPTYLSLPYEVRWKASLSDPSWLALTNLTGDGTPKTVAINPQAASRFYQVTRLCN